MCVGGGEGVVCMQAYMRGGYMHTWGRNVCMHISEGFVGESGLPAWGRVALDVCGTDACMCVCVKDCMCGMSGAYTCLE